MTPNEALKVANMMDSWPTLRSNEQATAALRSLADHVEALQGTLADIAYSDDMTLKIARAKAGRMYKTLEEK